MAKTGLENIYNIYLFIALSKGPVHGYELMKSIEEKTGKSISPGQVYPFIKKLSKNGYLSAKKGSRGKKTYSLTPNGRVFVRGILARFDVILEAALESKIKKCVHCSCEVYKGWHAKKFGGKKMFFCCKGCAASWKASK